MSSSYFAVALVLWLAVFSSVLSIPQLSIIVNVRGKKHKIVAETVHEVCNQVNSIADIDISMQSVIFNGKTLSKLDRLDEVGVANGDTLNIIKSLAKRPPSLLEEFANRFQGLEEGSLVPQSQSASLKGMVREKVLKVIEKLINSVLDAAEDFLSADMIEGIVHYLQDAFGILERLKDEKGAEKDAELKKVIETTWKNIEEKLGVFDKQDASIFAKGFLLKVKENLLRYRRLRDEGQWSPMSHLGNLKFSPNPNPSSNHPEDEEG
ncbi:MAG: hypothetical protein EOO06_18540 [Chitinophagaceae bacterium]|nr:MAG: hypothetical protein EOO06_18540 [Chitinophagaceae bacterium]